MSCRPCFTRSKSHTSSAHRWLSLSTPSTYSKTCFEADRPGVDKKITFGRFAFDAINMDRDRLPPLLLKKEIFLKDCHDNQQGADMTRKKAPDRQERETRIFLDAVEKSFKSKKASYQALAGIERPLDAGSDRNRG